MTYLSLWKKKILHLRHLRKVRQSMPICPVLQLSFRGLLDNVNIFYSILLFYSQQISPKLCIRVFSCLIINSSFYVCLQCFTIKFTRHSAFCYDVINKLIHDYVLYDSWRLLFYPFHLIVYIILKHLRAAHILIYVIVCL